MLYYLIFIFAGLAVYLIITSFFQERSSARLSSLNINGYQQQRRDFMKKEESLAKKAAKPLAPLIQPFLKLEYIKNLQAQTEVLRIPFDISALILMKFVFAALLGILCFSLLSQAYAILAVLIGFFTPDMILLGKIKAKKEEISRIFPETIDLLDMCISSGADFISAIKWLIEKSDYNPFIEQLEIAMREIQVGRPRTEALKDMANRLKLADISSFVRTIIQSERMGTSIEEAFRNLSEDTRNMRFHIGERYAVKASLKILFPLLFCILPAIMIVVAGPIILKFMQGDLIPGAGAGF